MSATALPFAPTDRAEIPAGGAPEPAPFAGSERHSHVTRRYVPALRRWMQGRLPRWAHDAAPPETIDRASGEALGGLEPEAGDSVACDLHDLGALLRWITEDTTDAPAPFLTIIERAVTPAAAHRFRSAAAMRHALADVAVDGSGRATTNEWHARAAAWISARLRARF